MRNEIRQLREERGLSQGSLGAELGVSRQTVNSLETGRYDPSLPLAFTVARFFGLSISLIHISAPTRLRRISYAVFCLKQKQTRRGDHSIPRTRHGPTPLPTSPHLTT